MRLAGRYWLVCLFLLSVYTAQAQKEQNVWAFGTDDGLDFNTGTPVAINTAISSGEGCASICDTSGTLLFYTEGSIIWNRNNTVMPNGSNLTGLGTYATSSCTEGAAIVPMPDSVNKYYVFSLTEWEENSLYGRLYYSVVDMNLDGGLGDVVTGKKGIFMDSGLTERMVAIQGDRCDLWLLVLSQEGVFKAYEITDAGINPTPVTSSFPTNAVINPSFGAGNLVVSPDRKRLALSNFVLRSFTIFNFDPATGIVSDSLIIDSLNVGYAACFSPNNQVIYAALRPAAGVSPSSPVYQFDLSSGNAETIKQTKTQITSQQYSAIRLAPDGKIYCGTGGSPLIGIINNPDVPGSGCNFNANALSILTGGNVGSDFPNPAPVFIRDTVKVNNSQEVTSCFSNLVTLFANDSGWDYQWSGDTSKQTYRIVDSPGTYIVHYSTAPCIYHTDTFVVTFSSPLLPLVGAANGCLNSNNGTAWIQPQPGDTTTYTFIWTNSSADTLKPPVTLTAIGDTLHNQNPGTYKIIIQALNGCDTSLSVVIGQDIIAPLSGTVDGCIGQQNSEAWVQPHPGDTTTYTYTWTDAFGNVLQPLATSSIIADTLSNQYAGAYMVTMQSVSGCDTTLQVIIPLPAAPGFLQATDTGMCPHDTITIHATGAVSYHWQGDNKIYISDTSVADPSVSPLTDWSYVVYGSDSRGCLDTVNAHVRVYPGAVLQLPDSIILYYGESYQFNPGTNCLTFSWFPPLGLSADNISNPIASPPVDTKYIVTGTTEEGCAIKDSVNVYRSSDVVLTLPNAFTPGNGPDNLFKPIHEGDVTLDYLRIFNRWGQMVYESTDLNQGWDGSWHGVPQPESVYVYMMEGHTVVGKIISKQGNVTLLR